MGIKGPGRVRVGEGWWRSEGSKINVEVGAGRRRQMYERESVGKSEPCRIQHDVCDSSRKIQILGRLSMNVLGSGS